MRNTKDCKPSRDTTDCKPCPYCESTDLSDCYVFIKCNKCLMEGPKMNNGMNDAHADAYDRKNAIEAWNKLPRNLREKKLERVLKIKE